MLVKMERFRSIRSVRSGANSLRFSYELNGLSMLVEQSHVCSSRSSAAESLKEISTVDVTAYSIPVASPFHRRDSEFAGG
jgi:hypothetical protein